MATTATATIRPAARASVPPALPGTAGSAGGREVALRALAGAVVEGEVVGAGRADSGDVVVAAGGVQEAVVAEGHHPGDERARRVGAPGVVVANHAEEGARAQRGGGDGVERRGPGELGQPRGREAGRRAAPARP